MFEDVKFSFSAEKDAWLLEHRGIGFARVITLIEKGYVLGVEKHPSAKYLTQYIAAVSVDGYAYLVPFVKEGEQVFLKTIIPSRKATKKYLGGEDA